jgi:aspartyl aminopeptidase
VELYGGGLWNTWFDRDLSVAGRVVVASEDGKSFESKLCCIKVCMCSFLHVCMFSLTHSYSHTHTHTLTLTHTYSHTHTHTQEPILRIPNIAIHLNREIYTKGFNPNKETHVLPVLATEIKVCMYVCVCVRKCMCIKFTAATEIKVCMYVCMCVRT